MKFPICPVHIKSNIFLTVLHQSCRGQRQLSYISLQDWWRTVYTECHTLNRQEISFFTLQLCLVVAYFEEGKGKGYHRQQSMHKLASSEHAHVNGVARTADARAQRGHTTFASSLVPKPRPALSRLQYGIQKQLGGSWGCSPENFGIFELHRSILRLLQAIPSP